MDFRFYVLGFLFLVLTSGGVFADGLRTHTDRGTAALRKGDNDAAVEHFSAAVQIDPASNEAKFNLALAHTFRGEAQEAEAILSAIKFDDADKNISTLNLRAKIAETVGDFLAQNEQQPNFSQVRAAYQKARALYADALDINGGQKVNSRNRRKRDYLRVRIENLSHKIRNLPEDEQGEDGENENENDENQDGGQNNERNDENQDKNDENQEEQKQDEQENERNEQDRQNERERQEQEERIEDAVRLIELYADDASELNKPPVQKAAPAPGGKEW